jgi:hypothetical protein
LICIAEFDKPFITTKYKKKNKKKIKLVNSLKPCITAYAIKHFAKIISTTTYATTTTSSPHAALPPAKQADA